MPVIRVLCGLLLMSSVLLPARSWADTSAIPPAPGIRVTVGGIYLHLYCRGRGSPSVILDSGLGGTTLDWQRVQPAIARQTRVCSYDRPGYGWSDRDPQPPTALHLSTELQQLLVQGHIAPPYLLVGHSFGGLLVQLFAERHPAEVGGLVLVDSTLADQFAHFAAAGVGLPLAPPRNRWFVVGNFSHLPDGLPAQWRAAAAALARSPNTIDTIYRELRYLQFNTREVYQLGGRLPDVPLIVLAHDARSRAQDKQHRRLAQTWVALQQQLAESVPQGRLVLTRRSGHYIQLDQPDLVIEAIREIIDRIRGGE